MSTPVEWDAMEEESARKRAQSESKFIPQEGIEHLVFVKKDKPLRDPPVEGKNKKPYVMVHLAVVVDGKDKDWAIFDNQFYDVVQALKKHSSDRKIIVKKAAGSKKLAFS